MAILTPDSTLLGSIRGYTAAWRERVSQILQAIQTKFTNDETERLLSNKLKRGWSGTLDPTPVITLVSDGVNWTLTLTGTGTVDLACIFAGVEHTFDATPAASINLTTGTDIAPKRNFVYLTESGGTVTLNANTTGFPTATAHIHIAEAFLQSVASGQTEGPRQSQQWSDHIDDGFSGGLDHVREKARHLGASWESGVAPGDMVVSAPDAYLSVGSGIVYQLHMHNFPALNMQSGDVFFVVNDPTTPNKPITSLDDITQLADSGAINNRHFPLVMWASQNANDTGQVYINLPTGSYATAAKAALDANKYAVFSIPTAYSGTAFLVAEYFVQGKDSGTWVQSSKKSLREPGAFSPGGAAAITTHTDLDGLTTGDAGHTQLHTDAKALTWLADGGAEGGQPVSLWEQIKAGFNLSGGGTISLSAGGVFKWTARFIAISNGRGAHFSTAGFFDIIKPDGGILVGVGGASDRTWVVAGIVLNAWEALYYILPIGSDNTSLLANFRVADYRNALEVPADWILLAVRNGDDGIVKVGTGIHLGLGESRTNETVPKSLYDAQSVLVAVSDNTPVVQAVADSEFVGRAAGGDVGVMTAAQARTVLGFTQEKVVDIGDWDMDATDEVSVAHGLTVGDIRGITAIIRTDNGLTLSELPAHKTTGTAQAWVRFIDSTNVGIRRLAGGFFDANADYDDGTDFNRGWTIIKHV